MFRSITFIKRLYPSLVDSKLLVPVRDHDPICVYIPLWLIRNEIGHFCHFACLFISLFGWFETANMPSTHIRGIVYIPLWLIRNFSENLWIVLLPVYIPLWLIRNWAWCYGRNRDSRVYIPLWLIRNVDATPSGTPPDGLYPSLVDSKPGALGIKEETHKFISLFGWFETQHRQREILQLPGFISLFGWFETKPIQSMSPLQKRLYPSLVDSKLLKEVCYQNKWKFISLFGWFETLFCLEAHQETRLRLYPSLVDSKRLSLSRSIEWITVYIPLWLIRNGSSSGHTGTATSLYPSLVDSKL